MSWKLQSQPSAVGHDWLRLKLFGADPTSVASPKHLQARLVETLQEVSQQFARAQREIEDLHDGFTSPQQTNDLAQALAESSMRLDAAYESLGNRDVEQPFRVVLMGQTMAGKSTLFKHLTGDVRTRIGVGGQRTTRDVREGAVGEMGFVVVDTPGVGALDGDADYELAFGQVPDADLILWVTRDGGTQEQTGKALERLADLGKPILIALNCFFDVSSTFGLEDMLEDPSQVFDGARGNLARIEHHLSRVGGSYLSAVSVHAQAALVASTGTLSEDEASTLYRNSRLDDLLTEIRDQADRTAVQRRIASIGDALRFELLETAADLSRSIDQAQTMLSMMQGVQAEFHQRATRRIADAHAELKARFFSATSSRHGWADRLDADLGERKINAAWSREIDDLRAEVDQHAADVSARLGAGLEEISADVSNDWAYRDVGQFSDLGNRSFLWGNRLIKAGGRVAVQLGATALGAKIGSVVGSIVLPGPGTAIGGLLGVGIGMALDLLGVGRGIDWVGDKAFRSKAQLREQRRQKLRDQLPPLLDELDEQLRINADKIRETWQAAVDQEHDRQSASAATIEPTSRVLRRMLSSSVEPLLGQVDTEIARELLAVQGRSRAAASLIRATRWRGAGTAVELPEPAFSELVLFPLQSDVERIMPTAQHTPHTSSALQLVRSLSPRETTVHYMDAEKIHVSLAHPLPSGHRDPWEALIQAHTSVRVHIDQAVEQEGARP